MFASRCIGIIGDFALILYDCRGVTIQMTQPQMKRSESGYDITPISEETRQRLAKDLTDEERRIMLDHGTEPAFCGTLLDNKQEGTYACRLCGLPLFTSKYKFDSGTGWPYFYAPIDPDHLRTLRAATYGMIRI